MSESADTLRKNWLASLAHERRASPHTLRAYGAHLARFIGFQAGHTGGAMTQKALAKLSQADIRAFITSRRSEGLGPGGVQRALAAVRSFYKFLPRKAFWKMLPPDPSARRACAEACHGRFRRLMLSGRLRKRAITRSNGWARAMPRC